jgi:hypothetical protein
MMPALSTPIVITPTSTPSGWPEPPAKATPPRMTAVSTSSSKFTPMSGWALPSRAVVSSATSPTRAPLMANSESVRRSVRIPARRVEVGFPPTA